MISRPVVFGLMIALTLLSPLAAQQAVSGGDKPADIIIGRTLSLPSMIFSPSVRLDVSLPEGYETSSDRYPLLIGFQVEDRFPAVSGIAAGLGRAEIAPPLIVVSVGLDGDLFSLYADEGQPSSGRGPDVLAFLRRELLPFLESRYRLAPFRILLGHSNSALFALNALFEAPDFVQAVLAAGPMFAEFDGARVAEILEKSLASRPAKSQYLLFTQGDQPELTPGLTAFEDLLKKRRPEGLIWEFDPEPGENHVSLALMTLYDGLRSLFAGWATLPEAVGLGGGTAIRAYKKSLADRFSYEIGMARSADFRLRIKWTEERNFDGLIGLCRFGCEERPQDYLSHLSLAIALEQAGRWGEAASAYEAALAVLPALPEERRGAIKARLAARLEAARNKVPGGRR
jgi:tetratricopeptide (TPR) repeat protein